MFFHCYSPTLNRFASADSIVPNPANPQSFNRYSYSYNNPINFRDPSGHNPICNQSGSVCSDGAYDDGTIWSPTKHYNAGLLIFEGDVTTKERAMGVKAADAIANRMADTVNPPRTGKGNISVDGGQMSPSEVFLKVFSGPITVRNTNKNLRIDGASVYAIASSKHALITIGNREITNHYLFIHEIFHTFDLVVLGDAANQAVLNAQNDPNLNFPNRPDLLELGLDEHDPRTWGFAGGNFSPWQKSRSGDSGEEFADMGIGWTYARWEASDFGRARADFMDVNMAEWLNAQISP